MQPHEFPRRVLALATGLTPQVVTETLYALAVAREPAFVPTEIRLITTVEGRQRALLQLLDPNDGHFHRLCREYGLEGRVRFDADCISVIRTAEGALADIRTPAENTLAADAITAFMRELCADPQAAVHASLAGGRKSMGYYFGYALSLFGRPQDRLSHVLVNEPFETHREFFYPPREPRVLYVVDRYGREERPVSTADARIDLADIPFVRLRDGLPQGLLTGDASFSTTVAQATTSIAPASLEFDLAGGCVLAGGERVAMPAALLSWYALLASARLRGEGRAGDGFVAVGELSADALIELYGRCAGGDGVRAISFANRLKSDGGITLELARERNARVKEALKAALGVNAASYGIAPKRERSGTRYGLRVGPDRIRRLD